MPKTLPEKIIFTIIMAAIMASVPPQVTQISVLGSTSWCRAGLVFFASASRKFCAPKVTAYWCGPL